MALSVGLCAIAPLPSTACSVKYISVHYLSGIGEFSRLLEFSGGSLLCP